MRDPLVGNRVRKVKGSFAFIEHRFLRHGFWASLSHDELLLYFFLTLVADRDGLSFYPYDKMCSLLTIDIDAYILARNSLIDKDLLAFDGTFFQVLSLPRMVVNQSSKLLKNRDDMETFDLATIKQIMRKQLGRDHDS